MKKIQKRVKMDYHRDLYDTGIADAMYLAGLIADDAKMTKTDLQKWIEAANLSVAEYTVPWVASASPHGREMALKWIESRTRPSPRQAGRLTAVWSPSRRTRTSILPRSSRSWSAKSIHQQPNRVKYVMNGCDRRGLPRETAPQGRGGYGQWHRQRSGRPCRSVHDSVRAGSNQEIRSTQRDRQEAQVAEVLIVL